jgi:hypothetical protein
MDDPREASTKKCHLKTKPRHRVWTPQLGLGRLDASRTKTGRFRDKQRRTFEQGTRSLSDSYLCTFDAYLSAFTVRVSAYTWLNTCEQGRYQYYGTGQHCTLRCGAALLLFGIVENTLLIYMYEAARYDLRTPNGRSALHGT